MVRRLQIMSLAIGQSGKPLYRRWCTGVSVDGLPDGKQTKECEVNRTIRRSQEALRVRDCCYALRPG